MKNKKFNLYDLSIPNDYNLKSIGITQGLLYNWTDCRIKFLFAINRLRLKKSSVNSIFGTLFHKGLETLYKTKINSFTEILKLMNNSVIDEIEKEQNKINSITIEEELWDKWLIACSVLFNKYIEFYKKEILMKKQNNRILYVEQVFETLFKEIGNPIINHKRIGRIDLVFKDLQNEYWIEDHKTKSRIDESSIKELLPIDIQGLFYCTSVENMLPIKIKGFIYDLIRKPEIKLGKSLRIFKNELIKKIQKDPNHYFKKIKYVYNNQEKRLFNIDTNKKIKEINQFLNRDLNWYRNQASCFKTFQCDHLMTCNNYNGYLINYEKIDTFFPELED